MPKPKDHYEVLGIERGADADRIRKAYRKLARQYHPDVNKAPDAAKRFSEVQEAYDVLSDEEKRRNYDQYGHANPGFGGAGAGGGFRPGPGGPGAGGRAAWTNADPSDFNAADFGSVFEQMFGGGGFDGGSRAQSPFGSRRARARTAQPERGQDLEHAISVTFLTAALGGNEQLRLAVDGSTQTISVKIPPGIESGAKLRVKGKGQAGPMGGPSGDLILTVEVGKHPYFRREGLDLLVDVPLNIVEAVQGASVEVPLLGGGSAQMKVPGGVSSGRKLRIRGKGITDAKGRAGDFYAVIQIAAPESGSLSEEARKAVSALAGELKNPRETAPYVDDLKG